MSETSAETHVGSCCDRWLADFRSALRAHASGTDKEKERRLKLALMQVQPFSGFTERDRQVVDERNKEYRANVNMNELYDQPDRRNNGLFRRLVLGATTLFAHALLKYANTLTVYGLEKLHTHVLDREGGTGLVSVMNHRSILDDPFLISAMLPLRLLVQQPEKVRWGLCASDICFRGGYLKRKFCTLGKVLPVVRFGGLQQPELDQLAALIQRGEWVHVYPEGRVVQMPRIERMRRGIGKVITRSYFLSGKAPVVLPIYQDGMERVMPQDPITNKCVSMVPSTGHEIFVLVGDPIHMQDLLDEHCACLNQQSISCDAPECVALYDAICARIGLALRLLRYQLRLKVQHNLNGRSPYGDPYEVS
ncbi:N-acylphosphatidylethanolamine synthase [Porphyridium purpureum]|uniref:Tafazzin family protein n=1 Tax=Porphyridium purpureum TaxID=35688 RepID=A0A5J4YV99_PORPP|nr:N-acylphosphatidylethanolamine synthase [Porphyridium purpureum]|eukprot:POR9581..scf227_4